MEPGTFIVLFCVVVVVVKALAALYNHHLFKTNPEAWAHKQRIELERQRAEEEAKSQRSERLRRNVGVGAVIARWFLMK
jgi:hypothetical protein